MWWQIGDVVAQENSMWMLMGDVVAHRELKMWWLTGIWEIWWLIGWR